MGHRKEAVTFIYVHLLNFRNWLRMKLPRVTRVVTGLLVGIHAIQTRYRFDSNANEESGEKIYQLKITRSKTEIIHTLRMLSNVKSASEVIQ
jgi:hypothetical protein